MPDHEGARRALSAGANFEHDNGETRGTDRLAQVVDLCSEAKRIAEADGHKFLAYLLAMAIQETRGAMRHHVEMRPGFEPARTTTNKLASLSPRKR